MTHRIKQFFQAASDVFLDLNVLDMVRFEDMDQDATAILKFNSGGSDTIKGDAARNLHRRLSALPMAEEEPRAECTPILSGGESGEGADDQDPPPPSNAIPRTIVVPGDALFLGRNKAWYYGKDKNGRGLILAFINAKGSCSVRPFDAETSIALGKHYGTGPYQEHFADLIEGTTELTVNSQPNLERDCKQRLPERLFAHLRKQIEAVA